MNRKATRLPISATIIASETRPIAPKKAANVDPWPIRLREKPARVEMIPAIPAIPNPGITKTSSVISVSPSPTRISSSHPTSSTV